MDRIDRSECVELIRDQSTLSTGSTKSLAKIQTQHHPIVKPLNNIELIEGGLQAYNQETICPSSSANSQLPTPPNQTIPNTSKSAPATLSSGAKFVHFDSHLEHLRPSSNNKNGANIYLINHHHQNQQLPSPVLIGNNDSSPASWINSWECCGTVTGTIPLGSFTLPLPIHSHSDHSHQHSHGLNIPKPVYYTGETTIVASRASDKSNTDGGPLDNGYYSEVARTTKDEGAPGHMV
ncbi:hypothetical protein PPACK8108_LOCUS1908 [Phakopsora pachyrhizi]|uniref:Uncharacterized protein n=1 Tax=Phakopsora pachyrhizi TaxID=170000 RepID=A0AAV0AGQ2_PHAPC|nr:hypothetical protein PPACK8108_LOCUS1908 [Phakopsora pachyrhizi]